MDWYAEAEVVPHFSGGTFFSFLPQVSVGGALGYCQQSNTLDFYSGGHTYGAGTEGQVSFHQFYGQFLVRIDPFHPAGRSPQLASGLFWSLV